MRKFTFITLACAMSIAVIGCGGKEDTAVSSNQEKVVIGEEKSEDTASDAKTVDVKAIADSLNSDITYTDKLTEVDLDTAKMFLNIGDVAIEESYIYESSGATAEEIVVIKCKDSDSAVKAKDAFIQRVKEQTENFTDYVPEEVPKLNDAVIAVKDVYAVLSVSGDSAKAKEIIGGALK